MHGCGHDGHTTMLVGAAQYLARTRNFDGTVYLIFQPGEEGYAGAKAMIDDGLFERFPAEEVYAMHNWPRLPAGQIGLNSGPMMSSADRIEITICGKGGHGAHPHLTVDPVVVAAPHHHRRADDRFAQCGAARQRRVSLCSVQAGSPGAFSVVPREAQADRYRAHVEDRHAGAGRATHHRAGRVDRARFWRRGARSFTSAFIRPRSITRSKARFAGDVAAELVGEDNVIRNLRAEHGRRGFLVHAAGQARLLSAPGAGRRAVELFPAQHADTISTTPSFRSAPRFSPRSPSAECPCQSIDHRRKPR